MEKVKQFWANHKVALKLGAFRILRGAAALLVSLFIAEITKDPAFVWLAPLLLGADKAIRDWSVK